LGATAASVAEDDRAARLLGPARAHGPISDPYLVVQLEEHFFAPARAPLGERAWNEAHGAGSALSLDEAITFALDR
jgi:hypothetical protein